MSKVCPLCGASYPDANVFCAADGATLRAAALDVGDLIGSVVADRYLVTDLIGEGGMGKVYLARHVRLPQQAAIKVLRPEQVRDAGAVARFTREAANASRIDHDRVARVYDFGETADGLVYLAMEYVAGQTMQKLLEEEGPLAPRRAAALVRQVADALDAAHRLGIVHRDLKPDNVLVVRDGDADSADPDVPAERVKVVDFGIAKALGGDEAPGAGLTRTGFIIGTPEYMSPEQVLGTALDARSDVYSLALLAYRALAGALPFGGRTPEETLTARLTNAARPLAELRPDAAFPPTVQAVFDAGLAREPDARPATAGTFARALAAAIESWQPSPAGVPPVGTPLSMLAIPAVPLPAGATAAAGGATLPMGAPAGLPLGATPTYGVAPVGAAPLGATPPAGVPPIPPGATPPTGVAPLPAATPAGGGKGGLLAAAAVAVLAVGAGAWWFTRDAAAPPAAASTAAPTASVTPPPAAGAASLAPPPAPAAPPTLAARDAATPKPAAKPVEKPVVDEAAAERAAARAAAASRTLDSLTRVLDPATATDVTARGAARALRALLPRLGTAEDSAWANIRLIEALYLGGDATGACRALGAARRTARTANQKQSVSRYERELGCGG